MRAPQWYSVSKSKVIVCIEICLNVKLCVLHLRDVIDLIGGLHEIAEDQVFVGHAVVHVGLFELNLV